jgi:hypothetical protein
MSAINNIYIPHAQPIRISQATVLNEMRRLREKNEEERKQKQEKEMKLARAKEENYLISIDFRYVKCIEDENQQLKIQLLDEQKKYENLVLHGKSGMPDAVPNPNHLVEAATVDTKPIPMLLRILARNNAKANAKAETKFKNLVLHGGDK